jgi:hypothetical protein
MIINKYEVTLRLVNDNTGESREITRTEYAYSVIDAVQQSFFTIAEEAGSAKITVVRIGPPIEDVIAATKEIVQKIKSLDLKYSKNGKSV